MAQLRNRVGLSLPAGQANACDVVLSTGWDQLWKADVCVLPTGIGQPENKSVALLTVLLSRVTTTRFGTKARNYPEACFVLGLPLTDSARDDALDCFLNDLRDDPRLTVSSLRARYSELGLVRRPPRLGAAKEKKLDAGQPAAATRRAPARQRAQRSPGEGPRVRPRRSQAQAGGRDSPGRWARSR